VAAGVSEFHFTENAKAHLKIIDPALVSPYYLRNRGTIINIGSVLSFYVWLAN
jgi:hypothetical protein